MSQLRCSPQHLQQVGQLFKNACQQTQEVFRQLASMSQSLQGEWQGPASQRFQQDFQQLQSQLYRSANILEQMAGSLHQAASRMAEAEHRASGGSGLLHSGMDGGASMGGGFGTESSGAPQMGGPPSEATTYTPVQDTAVPESPPPSQQEAAVPENTPLLHQETAQVGAPVDHESVQAAPLSASAHGPLLEITSSDSTDASAQVFDGTGSPASETTLVVSGELVEMGGKDDKLSAYFDAGSHADNQSAPPAQAFGGSSSPLLDRIHPFVQGDGDNCGKTSVAMAINAITGSKLSDFDLPEGCSLLTELNRHTQDTGLQWNDVNLNPDNWQKIEAAVGQGLPVVVGLNGEFSHTGRGHVVTIVGIEGDKVTYADPATGTFRETTRQRMLDAEQYPQGSFIMYPSA
ncbi:WXG100 family type VII secretion target [bacterium]|nr:WXG100 family type VII secretion target [bacterium]